jgi:hypothetical protein
MAAAHCRISMFKSEIPSLTHHSAGNTLTKLAYFEKALNATVYKDMWNITDTVAN